MEAQIAFKEDDFSKATKLYQKIRQGQEDDEGVMVNLSSATICDGNLEEGAKMLNMPDLTHDLLLNKAYIHIQKKEWGKANKALDDAEADCREAYENEPASVIADELATVSVQRAYIAGETGDYEKAVSLLTEVLKNKPSSLSTLAVGNNNLCALTHDSTTVFDAFKRLKPLSEAHFDARLSSSQREAIRYNSTLLMGQMRRATGKPMADALVRENTKSPLGYIAQASLLYGEGKLQKADELLRGFLKTSSSDSPTVRLMLSQILLEQGQLKAAVTELRGVTDLQHQLGVAATLVAAYEKHGDIKEAKAVLTDAISYWKVSNECIEIKNRNLSALLEACAKLQMRQKEWSDAAVTYKELQKLGIDTPEIKSGLIMCLSYTSVGEAEQLASTLPVAASDISAAQASDLLALKIRELAAKQASAPDAKTTKKKKKKKNKIPSHVIEGSSPPDPDRWKCQKERASYKALTKRQVRELKKERIEANTKRSRQEQSEREELKSTLRVYFDEVRAQEVKDVVE